MNKNTFHDINLIDDLDNPIDLRTKDKQNKKNIPPPPKPREKNIIPMSNCCAPNNKCSIQ